MRPSTGTWSASLFPPMKLYLGNPAHLAAGAGKDGAKSGAKSKDAEAMLSLSCRTVKPSIATAGRLSQRRLSSPTLPHRGLDPQVDHILRKNLFANGCTAAIRRRPSIIRSV